MQVLFVCTANICRSVSAAQLLREAVSLQPDRHDVEVLSAGTATVAGMPGCREAPALRDVWADHRSRQLDLSLVEVADLVLVAARDHRAAVISLAPQARARIFTIKQAGRICSWLSEPGGVISVGQALARSLAGHDELPAAPGADWDGVPAIPELPDQRWAWLIAEMDAARGVATRSTQVAEPPARTSRRHRRLQPEPTHPDDLPDPHVLGTELHDRVYDELKRATAALAAAMWETMADPPDGRA